MTGAPDLSPREARDRWLDKRRVDASESSISSYHYRLKLFVEWCEQNGIDSMRDLSGWDLESFEAHRRGQDVAPSTLKNELGTLQNWLEYCERIEVVEDGLAGKVDPPNVSIEDQSSDYMLGSDAATDLISHFRDEEFGSRRHATLELLWFTGARVGSVRALDLQDFDSDEGFVSFAHRSETGTPLKNTRDGQRVVGLPDETVDVVDHYVRNERWDVHDDHGRSPLLTSRDGRPTPGTIRDWVYQATLPCHYGPCPHDRDPRTCEYTEYNHASKCPSSRSPHRIRTGAITWMLNCGVPAEVVAERVNASLAVIERHYDKATAVEEFRERRLPHLDQLELSNHDDN